MRLLSTAGRIAAFGSLRRGPGIAAGIAPTAASAAPGATLPSSLPLSLSALALTALLATVTWAGPGQKVQEYGPPMKPAECERCKVQAAFAEKMRALCVGMDVIELKNGVGVVYTVEDPRTLSRVQRAVEWARDELQRFSEHPEGCQLCSYCKASRPVFGKLKREVVRTSDGAIFFMRSDDPEAARALKDWMARALKGAKELRPAPSR